MTSLYLYDDVIITSFWLQIRTQQVRFTLEPTFQGKTAMETYSFESPDFRFWSLEFHLWSPDFLFQSLEFHMKTFLKELDNNGHINRKLLLRAVQQKRFNNSILVTSPPDFKYDVITGFLWEVFITAEACNGQISIDKSLDPLWPCLSKQWAPLLLSSCAYLF